MFKFILIILDGFGLRDEKEGNAVAQANTPTLDKMLNECPVSSIETSGKYVGLPDGIMGNSEVGHMNIGAGRIVKQNLVRINDAIESDLLRNNSNLKKKFQHVNKNNSTLHILGLLSDGGVHSHLDHYKYILQTARYSNVEKISLHVITDGRDTSPTSGINYVRNLGSYIQEDKGFRIASICGRYYAMDRDSRWERIEKSYRMYIHGEGEKHLDSNSAIQTAYDNKITDEFILPAIISE
ncbi:uncharacterized protein METZ01_LOCUS374788, partial [marine metagenome]